MTAPATGAVDVGADAPLEEVVEGADVIVLLEEVVEVAADVVLGAPPPRPPLPSPRKTTATTTSTRALTAATAGQSHRGVPLPALGPPGPPGPPGDTGDWLADMQPTTFVTLRHVLPQHWSPCTRRTPSAARRLTYARHQGLVWQVVLQVVFQVVLQVVWEQVRPRLRGPGYLTEPLMSPPMK